MKSPLVSWLCDCSVAFVVEVPAASTGFVGNNETVRLLLDGFYVLFNVMFLSLLELCVCIAFELVPMLLTLHSCDSSFCIIMYFLYNWMLFYLLLLNHCLCFLYVVFCGDCDNYILGEFERCCVHLQSCWFETSVAPISLQVTYDGGVYC